AAVRPPPEPLLSPRFDLTIVETNRGAPSPVRALTLSRFTARCDPDVLDCAAAESPCEVPLGRDRARGAVGHVVGDGDVPASDELTEPFELAGPPPVGPIRQ